MPNNYKTYKLVKKKLILKYKKINRESLKVDSFISINDFLANEQSEGPDADPSDIRYHYQNYENINNFIYALTRKLHFNKIICRPNSSLKYTFNNAPFIVNNAMLYDYDKDILILPYNFKQDLLDCIDNKKRFVYFILMLIANNNKTYSHANIIIIDLSKKIIERYEPYGKKTKNKESEDFGYLIDYKFKNVLLKYFNLDDYEYLSPIDISPELGMQSKANAYKGMCVTYCLAYLQLRIMNPDISQKDIVSYFMKKSVNKLKDIILKYAKYVENTLKNISFDVKKIQNLSNIKYKKKNSYLIINKDGEQVIKEW
jgi:hypothetical protein